MRVSLVLKFFLAVAFGLLAALVAPAQAAFQVRSSNLLPEDVRTKFGWGILRVGCIDDGSVLFPLVTGVEQSASPVVRIAENGALLARINVESVPGFEKSEVLDVASVPDGITYVLASRIAWEQLESTEDGTVKQRSYQLEGRLWLLKFDRDGQFTGKVSLSANFSFPKLAVFPSGDLLIVGNGPGPRPGPNLLAGLFSPTGVLIMLVPLPEPIIKVWPSTDEQLRVEPVTGVDGNVYVIRSGEAAAAAIISDEGKVLRTFSFAGPRDMSMYMPRTGDHIWFQLYSRHGNTTQPKTYFAEFDLAGALISVYATSVRSAHPACVTPAGLEILNGGTGTLDVLEPN